MKKSVKRQQLFAMKSVLENIEDYFVVDMDVDTADKILRNVDTISAEFELYEKNPALQVPENFSEYDQKRMDIVKKYADVDDDGNIIMKNDQEASVSDENMVKLNEEVSELQEEYKETLDKVDAINKQRNEFLSKEVDVEIYPLDKSKLGKVKTEGRPSGFTLSVVSLIKPILAD